ncbi:hypothetical protein [Desulfohalovibrio reitneri]|uniref:hypothetical protein n=1 Tax=Desulfohalovibrio reitneri TaxID=1307759 RepID=UPI003134303F
MPVYAECGGFLYLCRTLEYGGQSYPMSGVLPLEAKVAQRPKGLGYVHAEAVRDNPYHPLGTSLRGHEFHYSFCPGSADIDPDAFCLRLHKGSGIARSREEACPGFQGSLDGLARDNVFASYTHIHALGAPHWAPRMVEAARAYKARRTKA